MFGKKSFSEEPLSKENLSIGLEDLLAQSTRSSHTLCGSYLDSFNAEAKRSWFSLRQSLKGVTSKGKLWLPATVTLAEGRLRVSTTEWTEEFRPRRLIWKSPNRFLLVGLRESSELRRSFLRFISAEEASRAASRVKEIGAVIEEPLVPVEEIQVQVRLLYTWAELSILLYLFFIRILIWGFLISIISTVLGLTPFVPGLVVLLYVAVTIWATVERTRRSIAAWLRFQGKSFAVRTQGDWIGMVPKVMEWKREETFVLKGSGRKVEISLPTSDEAARVAMKIRTTFPEIEEAPFGL